MHSMHACIKHDLQRASKHDWARYSTILWTAHAEPPPPTGIVPLCDVIVWETPDYYCDGSTLKGYQVQFNDPTAADAQTTLIRDVPENRTFYVVKDEDRLGGPHNTTIRVRKL